MMKTVLLCLLATACGDSTTPSMPDASVDAAADAYVAPECVMPPAYDGSGCHATIPGAACGQTFGLPNGTRGCCVKDYVNGETHFLQCQ